MGVGGIIANPTPGPKRTTMRAVVDGVMVGLGVAKRLTERWVG